ncbi:MAG TPA: STAS domain-containing protein [Thermoleophilaceae bacterium]
MTEIAEIEVHRQDLGGDEHLISVAGQVDLYTAPELKVAVTQVIDDGAQRVIVDLTETTFMDSTGLGVLVGAKKRLRALDGSIAIVSPDAGIRRLFEISGLTHLFEIYETRP